MATVAGEIGDAEDGNLVVRLIALENIIVALLADASENQSQLVREMASYISPRPAITRRNRSSRSSAIRSIISTAAQSRPGRFR